MIWTPIYIRFGNTLYREYKVIYLVVVKDENHDSKGQGRDSNRQGIC